MPGEPEESRFGVDGTAPTQSAPAADSSSVSPTFPPCHCHSDPATPLAAFASCFIWPLWSSIFSFASERLLALLYFMFDWAYYEPNLPLPLLPTSQPQAPPRSYSPTRTPTSAEIDAVIAAAIANAPPAPPPPEIDRSTTPLMTNLLPSAVGLDGRVNLFVGNVRTSRVTRDQC